MVDLFWHPRSLATRQLLAAGLGLVAFLALVGVALDRAFIDIQSLFNPLVQTHQHVARTGSRLGPRLPGNQRRYTDILKCSKLRQQLVELKDKSYVFVPE